MAHEICRACEWVALCTKRQHCVPITVEGDSAMRQHQAIKARNAAVVKALQDKLDGVMSAPLNREEADAPVSTPEQTMTWPKRALQFAFRAVLAGALFALVALNWPLFLAAVK